MVASKLDIDAAVKYLDGHAKSHATGFCAKAVRSAILAGRVDISPHPGIAKSYGIYLQRSGFSLQPVTGYVPAKGDVVVLQSYTGGQPAGHIAMYDGTQWVSDFKQRDMWAGPGYRKHKPQYAIYRPRT
jgi:type VI secretion system secreted protein VgrG